MRSQPPKSHKLKLAALPCSVGSALGALAGDRWLTIPDVVSLCCVGAVMDARVWEKGEIRTGKTSGMTLGEKPGKEMAQVG